MFSKYNLRQTISLQESRATRESVSMRTPVLAVARLAVHILVGTVARIDRVQRLRAVVTLEALAMPLATLAQYLLGGKHDAATAGTALTGRRLNLGRVDDARFGGQSAD